MKPRETAAQRDERIVRECGFRFVTVRFNPAVTPIPGSVPEVDRAEVIVPRQFFNNGHSFADWTAALARILNRLRAPQPKRYDALTAVQEEACNCPTVHGLDGPCAAQPAPKP